MKKTFTKEYILINRGCYSSKQTNELSFMNKKSIHINDILKSSMLIKDKTWFLCNKCSLSKKQNVFIAIECARLVLHIFEDKYPNDDRPKKAIQSAKKWLENTNADAASSAYAGDAADAAGDDAYASYAGSAASYDADAADAAYSAAYAAYASYADAGDAGDAAYAAAYAADSSTAADDDKILTFLLNYVKSQ